MATRGAIGIEKDGKIMAVYCHWDNYLESTGETLFKHYQNPEKILTMISLGDMSSLGEEIGEKHDFDGPNLSNWCTYYGRDRGEDNVEFRVFNTRNEFVQWYSDSDYFYLYSDKKWTYSQGEGWFDLADALERIESERAE